MDELGWQEQREASPIRFQILLAGLGLSQAACGRYLGVSGRTIKRYIDGDSPVPVGYVLLLSGLLAAGTKPIVPKRSKV